MIYIITGLHEPCFITNDEGEAQGFERPADAFECAKKNRLCKAYGFTLLQWAAGQNPTARWYRGDLV